VRLSHDPARTHASFDDPNLVSRGGLIPVMALAGRCGLADLAGEHVKIASRTGVRPELITVQGWRNSRSRSGMKISCRFSSPMSLSHTACRLNVACDMFAVTEHRVWHLGIEFGVRKRHRR
jgi:hypothetical protein